jgi:hypothetical protein
MSVTLQDAPTAPLADAANLEAMSAALRARLARRAPSAPKQELDQLLNLIGALDSAGKPRARPAPTEERKAPVRVQPERESHLRHYIYERAAYAPTPVYRGARALGHALRFLGM